MQKCVSFAELSKNSLKSCEFPVPLNTLFSIRIERGELRFQGDVNEVTSQKTRNFENSFVQIRKRLLFLVFRKLYKCEKFK